MSISCDGQPFTAWRAAGRDEVEIDTTVGGHVFRVQTGYHGGPASEGSHRSLGVTKRSYLPSIPAGGSCCPG